MALPVLHDAAARRIAYRYAALAAFAACVFAFRWLSFTGFSNDHYVHLSGAQQMSMGYWPIRDFVEPGLPLTRAVSWAWQVAFGEGLQAELVLVSAALAAAAVCSVLAAVHLGSAWRVATVAAMAQVAVYPVSYSYPKLLVHGVGIWMLARAFGAPASGWRAASLGAWVGVAFLFRHDHGILLASSVLVAWVVARRLRVAVPARSLLLCSAGALCVIGPYLLYVQFSEGMGRFVADSLAFSAREGDRTRLSRPVFSVDPGPWLAWRTASPGGPTVKVRWNPGVVATVRGALEQGLGLVQVGQEEDGRTVSYRLSDWSTGTLRALVTSPLVEDTHGIVRSTYSLEEAQELPLAGRIRQWMPPAPVLLPALRVTRNAEVLLFYFVVLLPLFVLGLLYRLRAQLPPYGLAVLAGVAALQVAVNVVFLRDSLNVRIQDVCAPATVLVAWCAHALSGTRSAGAARPWRAVAAGLMLVGFVVVSGTVGSSDERLVETGLLDGWRGARQRVHEVRHELAPPGERVGRATAEERQLADYLRSCSAPGQLIFAPVLEPEIFFQSARGFAGGHVSLLAGYFNDDYHQSLMLERLNRQDVPYVVVTEDGWPGQRQSIPRVVAWVDERYRVAARIGSAPGKEFVVMADTRRVSSRLWNGWPCFA